MPTERARTRRPSTPISVAVAAFAVYSLGADVRTHPAATRPPSQSSSAAFTRSCAACHTSERVLAKRRDLGQWEEVIENMLSRGARVTDDDYDPILSYLLEQAGRVNVNRAPADDIVAVLTIPAEHATAIVEYRTKHGHFADFDALLKVPGLDAKKMQQLRDAISF